MQIIGLKEVHITSKILPESSSSHTILFWNTSRDKTPTSSLNLTLAFPFSRDNSIQERNKDSSSKTCISSFSCSSMKKRKFCTVISRRKLSQPVSTNKEVLLNWPEPSLNCSILDCWSHRQNRSNLALPTSAKYHRLMNLKSTETMISLLKRRERKDQKDLLPNPCPLSKEISLFSQNNSKEDSTKKSELSTMMRNVSKLKESSSLSAQWSSPWNMLITITWTAPSSNFSRWLRREETKSSESMKSSWRKSSKSWSTRNSAKELRARETYSDILLDYRKIVFNYTVQISIISSILLFRRADSLSNIRN